MSNYSRRRAGHQHADGQYYQPGSRAQPTSSQQSFTAMLQRESLRSGSAVLATAVQTAGQVTAQQPVAPQLPLPARGGQGRDMEILGTRGTFASYQENRRAVHGNALPVYSPDNVNDDTTATRLNNASIIQGNHQGPNLALSGQSAFVVSDQGQLRMGAPLFGRNRLNHTHIADMAESVRFAGTALFDQGVLESWNNSSGGYRSHTANAHQSGMNMNRFEHLNEYRAIRRGMPD